MGNGIKTQNDHYLEGVMEGNDIPTIAVTIPSGETGLGAIKSDAIQKFTETLNVDTDTATSLAEKAVESISFKANFGQVGLSILPMEHNNQPVCVVLQPDTDQIQDFKETLLAPQSIVTSLPGEGKHWAKGAGIHEKTHCFPKNRNLGNILEKEIPADQARIAYYEENGLSNLTESYKNLRNVYSIADPDHAVGIYLSGEEVPADAYDRALDFEFLVKKSVSESEYGNLNTTEGSLVDNLNNFINNNTAEYTVMAANILKEGGLEHIENQTIQKHVHSFLRSYDEIKANPSIYNQNDPERIQRIESALEEKIKPKLETLDGQPVLDGHGNAIRIGGDDASNDPSVSVDPNLFKTPASSPAHVNTAANKMAPNRVTSLSGEFLTKGAANEEGSPSVQVVPKNQQQLALTEHNPTSALTPAA